MPCFFFFCVKSLRQACMIVAVLYLLFCIYDIIWALYNMLSYSHWFYYLTIIVSVVSLPFHAFLFLGAKQERIDYVYPWIIFTMLVTFPFCLIYLAVCIIEGLLLTLLQGVLTVALRVYMWMQVRAYHTQLGMPPQGTTADFAKTDNDQMPSSQYPAMAV